MADAGSVIKLETVQMDRGTHHELASATYEKALATKFQICKNPELYDGQDRVITRDEFRMLSTWLNRSSFLPFRAIDPDDLQSGNCYYNASFNLSKIQIADRTYGIELEMTTNAPFGYGDQIEHVLSFQESGDQNTIQCFGDEYCFVYPDLTIECGEEGELHLSCDLGRCDFKVRECYQGEVIHVDGARRIITTSRNTHNIASSFNYEFFRIGKTTGNAENIITSDGIPCTITLTYRPIIKDTPY